MSRDALRAVPYWVKALVLVAVGTGVALRVFVLTTDLGHIDADEAVWGLMAQRVLDGEFPVFFWRQGYAGTAQTYLTAAVFGVLGSGLVALRILPILLWVAAAILVWRVGRRMLDEQAALIAAALFWVWPAYGIWRSARAHGSNSLLVVLSLAVVLLALRLAERPTRRDAALLGLALGVGWWSSPQIVLVAGPVLLWLLVRHREVLRLVPVAAPGALVGALPWIVWNAQRNWLSLDLLLGEGGGGGTYDGRLEGFVRSTLPQAFGLRAPFSLEWIPGRVAGLILLAAALVPLAWLLLRRRRPLEPLLAICLLYPLLYSASSFAWLTREPRYLILLLPVLVLLLAPVLSRTSALAVLGVAAAIALSVLGLRASERSPELAPVAFHVPEVGSYDPLIHELRRQGVRNGYSDYWVAYPITFLTEEKIVFATSGIAFSRGIERKAEYAEQVRRDPNRAYVYFASLPPREEEVRQQRELEARGYEKQVVGGYVLYTRERAATAEGSAAAGAAGAASPSR